MKTATELVPLLVVRGAARAIDFYVQTLGARVLAQYEHGTDRHISHAELSVGAVPFALTEEARAWNSDAPPSLGGSPVVLQLGVVNAEAALESMRDAGAEVIFPLQELLGERMARVRDPFGHIWLLRQRLEQLSVDAIQRQRDEFFRLATAAGPTTTGSTRAAAGESPSRLQGQPARPQAQKPAGGSRPGTVAEPRRASVHLVVGPVGAGKSSYALELARTQGAVRLTLDEWMRVLFRDDRPEHGVVDWYVERARRAVDQIWDVAESVMAVGTDVVLEIGLLRREERLDFYRRVDDAGWALTIHVLDAARHVRRERVEQRNRLGGPTFSMEVPPAVFELASDLWEPPEPAECAGRDVRFLRTDTI